MFLFPWTQAGCEDLADLPVSDSLSVEWGDSEFVVSEPMLSIPLKNTKITKKEKYELRVKTKNGDFQGWVIATELKAKLKVKKGQVVGLKRKGRSVLFRYLSGGIPALAVQINS